jgi:tRNA(His) guanylyltransferase
MKFDELDKQMRIFETAHDYNIIPGIYIVARIDGRSFTKLTKEVHKFEVP